jgi:hypothetical protein
MEEQLKKYLCINNELCTYYNDYNPSENECTINTTPIIVNATTKEDATQLVLDILVSNNLIGPDAAFKSVEHELYRMNKYQVWLHTEEI